MRWIAEVLALKWGHAGVESVGKKSTVALKWTERRGEDMENRKQLYLCFTPFKTPVFVKKIEQQIFLAFQFNFSEIMLIAHIGKCR